MKLSLPTKILSGALVAMSVGAAVVGAQSTDTTKTKMNHLKFDPTVRAEEIKLINAGDYNAWAAYEKAQGHDKILEKITAENFPTLKDIETALEAKDFAKAKELGQKLGLPTPGKMKREMRREMRQEFRGELKAQIDKLSDSVKAELKAAHQAKDPEKVRSILEANGITMPEPPFFKNLPDSVKTELKAAMKSGDRSKVESILKANGITLPAHPEGHPAEDDSAPDSK